MLQAQASLSKSSGVILSKHEDSSLMFVKKSVNLSIVRHCLTSKLDIYTYLQVQVSKEVYSTPKVLEMSSIGCLSAKMGSFCA